MAFRDQGRRGRRFISSGVETVPRFKKGTLTTWPDTKNPSSPTPQRLTTTTAEGGVDWHDARGTGDVPDVYIAMGPDR